MKTTIQVQTYEEKNPAFGEYWSLIVDKHASQRLVIVVSILVFYALLTAFVSFT
ncbi:MAG TPA: hypothetical protein VK809_00050 [Bacteroidia bacterium]|nr:hypothetical protein [Bacteroidia bacterium]